MTGSSGGIGRVISLYLARSGADIAAHFKLNECAVNTLACLIAGMGKRCLPVRSDITQPGEVQEMIKRTLDKFGRLDILVNCAGIFHDASIIKMPPEAWNEVVAVNLSGTFHATKEVIPVMRQNGFGRIINVSSVVGQMGVFGASNYAAAKAGIFGFTKAAAREVVKYGITVNALALGYIDTGMLHKLSPDLQAGILKQIPIGRFGVPEEVAATAAFLCSELAGYITGQVISVNGGCYM